MSYFGEDAKLIEHESATNLKRTWTVTNHRDWIIEGKGTEFLRQASQVKNIWTPYGE